MLPFTWRHVLYRLYAADGELLYVGITFSVAARFPQHAAHSPWWPEVASCSVQFLPTRTALREAERVAITTEHPRHNRVHAEVYWRGSAEPVSRARQCDVCGSDMPPWKARRSVEPGTCQRCRRLPAAERWATARVCAVCGAEFRSKSATRLYCGGRCKTTATRRRFIDRRATLDTVPPSA